MTPAECKAAVIAAGKKLTKTGLIARTWGNVSCRIDPLHFAITPSGRSYESLVPEEIVEVRIADCSYDGNIKPSSEKGIHADVYRLHPEANFVIHTHQDIASIIGVLGLSAMKTPAGHPLLGQEVPIAAYGLPGTKKLRRNMCTALGKCSGQALLMKNHGALCFGRNPEEAFEAAVELEKACEEFILAQYERLSSSAAHPEELIRYSIGRLSKTEEFTLDLGSETHYESERTSKGITLRKYQAGKLSETELVPADNEGSSVEALLHRRIYQDHSGTSALIHSRSPYVSAVSAAGLNVKAYLDDFAQIIGSTVINIPAIAEVSKISSALSKASAVLVQNDGAICSGRTMEDARAVSYILEKGCRTLVEASLFETIKPLGYLDCVLMRFVYLKKYSKQAEKKLLKGGRQ